jgi:hypothetical protein
VQTTATEIYEELLRRDETIQPDLVTYNTMLSLYLHPSSKKHNDVPRAMRIYEAIHASGLTPDALSFLGILRSCSYQAETTVARRMWRDICTAKITPGSVLVSQLLRCFRFDADGFNAISRELVVVGVSIPAGYESLEDMRKASKFVNMEKPSAQKDYRS